MEQDYNEWFSKRLKEVMEHKGLTAKGLGELSGVGRMTISRILQGRYATAEEVKKIADALEITVERLKQKDVDYSWESRKFGNPISNPEVALQLAMKNVDCALGRTEKVLAYQVLAYVYYSMNDFGKALEANWRSKELLEGCDDAKLVFETYQTLMFMLVILKDYVTLEEVFQQAESISKAHERYYYRILEYKASILVEHTKKYAEAYDIYLKTASYYKGRDDVNYCRTLCNLGDVSFRLKKYELSKQYYEKVFDGTLQNVNDEYLAHYVRKDFAKTLICLGEMERAREVLEPSLEAVLKQQDTKLVSLYLVLTELLNGDGAAAGKIHSLDLEDEKIKMLASMLMAYAHYQRGDKSAGLNVFREMLSDHLVLE